MKREVLILGAGLTGCALARELAQYKVKITVIERRPYLPLGLGHLCPSPFVEGGVPSPHPSEKHFSQMGYAFLIKLLATMKIPLQWTQGYFSAPTDVLNCPDSPLMASQKEEFPFRKAPSIWEEKMALVSPSLLNLALAENARENGVEFSWEEEILDLEEKEGSLEKVITSHREISSPLLINTATKTARTFESRQGWPLPFPSMVRETILTFPLHLVPEIDFYRSYSSKGIEFTFSRSLAHNLAFFQGGARNTLSAYETRAYRREVWNLLEKIGKVYPSLPPGELLAYWSQSRISSGDFLEVGEGQVEHYFRIRGGQKDSVISLGLAREGVRRLVQKYNLSPQGSFSPQWQPSFAQSSSPRQFNERFSRDGLYGRLLCPCQMITEGEVRDGAQSPFFRGYFAPFRALTGVSLGPCGGRICEAPLALAWSCHLEDESTSTSVFSFFSPLSLGGEK